jgi:DNA-binding transcriptional regulator PaaX
MRKLGPVPQKILLLLEGGLALALTRRPDSYFSIAKSISKEWEKINQRSLRESIKNLYKSKLVDCKYNKDGSVAISLTNEGKKRIINYDLDKIEIKKPAQWDKLWRLVIFDIPENKSRGRKALAAKLKELNFYPMQKSVFIHPYECKDEIDFITEIFELAPYVRFLRVRDVDIELDLKNKFHLS